MDEETLLQQILAAWRVNNGINLVLIDALDKKALNAVPQGSRGRNVARQLVHMHQVRIAWMRFNGVDEVRDLPRFARDIVPTRAQLMAAFRASGRVVQDFVQRRLREGRRIKYLKGQPVVWLVYLVSHESHHRGQIALTLKQNGMKLPESVAMAGLWGTWHSARELK